ncbi:MAG: tetratricopeptide repeat protein [Candidatus Poribacteria bacterium]|nr:tetratricopeptide repeat protein [Candidatus Poribacteria bacterium]MDE0504691.1 tetratricopeptide repeat protein [Candidatus Poribacteria bacterium]
MPEQNGFSELAKLMHQQPDRKTALRRVLSENYSQETLIDSLENQKPLTCRAAAYALGEIANEGAIPSLVGALTHDDPGTRANAEQALWSIWFRSEDESVDDMMQQGVIQIKKQRYDEAIQVFSEVIRIAADYAEGYNQRAIAYFMNDELSKSVEDCKRTIDLNPFHFGAFAGMGQCYLKLGDLTAALDAFQRAVEINPNLYAIARIIAEIQDTLQQHMEED